MIKSLQSKTLAFVAIALATGALAGCDSGLGTSSYDKTASHTAETGAEGVADGLLPEWVPASATDIQVEQRTTGDERLLKATYTGELPTSCVRIAKTGAPTESELSTAYSQDPRIKGRPASDFETAPLLKADWWPEDAPSRTTQLCGRWWVSQEDGTIYAFAPENTTVATNIKTERGEQ